MGRVVAATFTPSPTPAAQWAGGCPSAALYPLVMGKARGVALPTPAQAGAATHPLRPSRSPTQPQPSPKWMLAGYLARGQGLRSQPAPRTRRGCTPREDAFPSAAGSFCGAGLGADQPQGWAGARAPQRPASCYPSELLPSPGGAAVGTPPHRAPGPVSLQPWLSCRAATGSVSPPLPSPRSQGSRNPCGDRAQSGTRESLEERWLCWAGARDSCGPGLRSSSGALGPAARAWGAPASLLWESTRAHPCQAWGHMCPTQAGPAPAWCSRCG